MKEEKAKIAGKLLLAFSILLVFIVACVSSGSVDNSGSPATPAPTPTPAAVSKISPFVVPVIVIDALGKDVGLASAFLVDGKEGLFVTNAHVVAAGEKLEIRIGDTWYPIETRKEWIYWEADLAAMKLNNGGGTLPESAVLGVSSAVIDSMVKIEGYIVKETDKESGYIDSYFVDGLIKKINADWDINIGSKLAKIELIVSLLKDETKIPLRDLEIIPNEYKHWFYENYTVVAVKDYSDKKFQDGLSGAPVIAEDGKVIGVWSSSITTLGLAVPSVEIKFLIEMVKYTLAAR